jgi:hypothetical protein
MRSTGLLEVAFDGTSGPLFAIMLFLLFVIVDKKKSQPDKRMPIISTSYNFFKQKFLILNFEASTKFPKYKN